MNFFHLFVLLNFACASGGWCLMCETRPKRMLQYFLYFHQHDAVPFVLGYELKQVIKYIVSFQLLYHNFWNIQKHWSQWLQKLEIFHGESWYVLPELSAHRLGVLMGERYLSMNLFEKGYDQKGSIVCIVRQMLHNNDHQILLLI